MSLRQTPQLIAKISTTKYRDQRPLIAKIVQHNGSLSMASLGPYNGYTGAEREKVGRMLLSMQRLGLLPFPTGPCDLCLDPGGPGVKFEYHCEDYSIPLKMSPPSMFCLCVHCHRSKLHKRTLNPDRWLAFLRHVRRGGYGRESTGVAYGAEFNRLRQAMTVNSATSLQVLRSKRSVWLDWFDRLNGT